MNATEWLIFALTVSLVLNWGAGYYGGYTGTLDPGDLSISTNVQEAFGNYEPSVDNLGDSQLQAGSDYPTGIQLLYSSVKTLPFAPAILLKSFGVKSETGIPGIVSAVMMIIWTLLIMYFITGRSTQNQDTRFS